MWHGREFSGLTYVVPIHEWRRRPTGSDEYRAVINLLIDNGHSFAVYGGYLYLSASATKLLIDQQKIDPNTMSEEL